MHHVITVQRVTGFPGRSIPILWINECPVSDPFRTRPHAPLIDYFIRRDAMSTAWMRQTARGVGLLYDYLIQCNYPSDQIAPTLAVNDVDHTIRARFVNHIYRGTFDAEGRDATGLLWLPRTPDAARAMMRGIDGYADWLETTSPPQQAVRQIDRGSMHLTGKDLAQFLAATEVRRKVGFLSHIKHLSHSKPRLASHIIRKTRSRGAARPDGNRFPIRHLGSLFTHGIEHPTSRNDPTDTLIRATTRLATLLCALTGVRCSEPLHLWVNDVQFVNGEVLLLMQHPEYAVVSHPRFGRITRAEYLRLFCDMEPRNLSYGRFHSGFKGLKLNREHWAPLYCLPLPGARRLLTSTVIQYISHVRPRLMHLRRQTGGRDHPFLLVSPGSKSHLQAEPGDPYTLPAFRQAFRRAAQRLRTHVGPIEAAAIPLTPHPLRHMYAGFLADIGIKRHIRRECLHHNSPLSTDMYTTPLNSRVNDALNAAYAQTSNAPYAAPPYLQLDDAIRRISHSIDGEFDD